MPEPTLEPDLLEPEFREPFTAWQTDPSSANTSVILKKINPVLTAAMRSYTPQSSPTLFSRAKLIALDAMKRYDPTQSKLRTHLMFQLQGLRRHAAKEGQIISVPEQVMLDMSNLRNAENSLRDNLGRDPSDLELADNTGLSLKRITYIRRSARPTYSEGSLQRVTDDGENIYTPSVINPNRPVRRSLLKNWYEFVYHDLAPKDQVILEHTLGLHGKQQISNQDIAKKLGMTPGAISQRKVKIQQKLDLREQLGFV